jgi:TonB family protein
MFEYKLQSALLSPLPETGKLDPANTYLDLREVKLDGANKSSCIMVVPKMPQHGHLLEVPLGLFPTYCFDPNLPVLRIVNSLGTVATVFNKIAKVQGCYLPMEFGFLEKSRQILTAKVDAVNGVPPSDPAFTPSSSAIYPKADIVPVSAGVMVGMLLKKQQPVYPQDAKDARASGIVVLEATIGRDGKVHDLRVVQAPWPSLVASAIQAVSQWEYKPYLLNGEPVEVKTNINVIFSLGG